MKVKVKEGSEAVSSFDGDDCSSEEDEFWLSKGGGLVGSCSGG